MTTGRRIKVTSGYAIAGFLLAAPPFPEIGDTVQFEGREWICTSSEPEEILIHIPLPGKVTSCSVTLLDGRKGTGDSMKAAIGNAKSKRIRKARKEPA
jgi:hypothetical protein